MFQRFIAFEYLTRYYGSSQKSIPKLCCGSCNRVRSCCAFPPVLTPFSPSYFSLFSLLYAPMPPPPMTICMKFWASAGSSLIRSLICKTMSNLRFPFPVRSDASNIEIKRAYKKKALIHHPDKQTASSPQAAKRAADKMQKINQA